MDNEFVRTDMKDTGPEFQQIVTRMMGIFDGTGEELACGVKWGRLAYAQNGDFHHRIVGFKDTRKFVGLLEDPGGVFIIGTSKFGTVNWMYFNYLSTTFKISLYLQCSHKRCFLFFVLSGRHWRLTFSVNTVPKSVVDTKWSIP